MLKITLLNLMFKQYQPFFAFLAKFLLFYLFFALGYKFYLSQFDIAKFEIDSISKSVANQTVYLINFFGGEVRTFPNEFEASMKIVFKEKYVARIIEGCNAISVIILFAAFVFAFSKGFKKTILFILLGSATIYILNIVRIALLTYAMYYYPEHEELLHGTIFPLFIYGVVFLLWVFWVTKFSGYAKKNIEE